MMRLAKPRKITAFILIAITVLLYTMIIVRDATDVVSMSQRLGVTEQIVTHHHGQGKIQDTTRVSNKPIQEMSMQQKITRPSTETLEENPAQVKPQDTKISKKPLEEILMLQTNTEQSEVSLHDTRDKAQLDRLTRIRQVCNETNVPGTVGKLYAYMPKNVTYCYSYKAASTYWIQIFRFLHGDVPSHVDRPSQISKFDSHLSPMKKTQRLEYFNEKEFYKVVTSFRFMMARDPYHRLWSVYVDKFVLLDLYFWSDYAPKVRLVNGIEGASRCDTISFTDMLTYVVQAGKTKPENLEPHLRPIHYGCNPCIYKPHFVGKVETLTKEKTPILEKLGMERFDDVSDFKSHVINEMMMITDFVEKLWHMPNKFLRCMSDKDLEARIVRTFVINGYLSEEDQLVLNKQMPLGTGRLKTAVTEIFVNSSRTSKDASEQRNRIRIQSFKSVPMHILYKIRDLFKFDFSLFGYDQMPKEIFNRTEDNS